MVGCFVVSACDRQKDEQLSIGEIRLTNYTIAKLATFRPFQAKIALKDARAYLDKPSGKTNFLFVIILEMTNGQAFTVFDYPTSLKSFELENSSLKKDSNYIFPNELITKGIIK